MNRALKLIILIEGFYKKTPTEQKLSDETASRDFGVRKASILDSVRKYTGSSHEYMNNQLRNGIDKKARPGSGWATDWSRQIADTKEATKNPTQHSFTAYRGINHSSPNKFEEGDLIHDKAFVSTSTNKPQANKFKNSDPGRQGTLFKVHIEKGTKGAYVADHSLSSEEREFVIHPETTFRIGKTHLNKTGSVSHVDLHIHSQED